MAVTRPDPTITDAVAALDPPFGERVRAAREAAGLSRNQLAGGYGLAPMTWWKIENRPDHRPRPRTILAVCEALDAAGAPSPFDLDHVPAP